MKEQMEQKTEQKNTIPTPEQFDRLMMTAETTITVHTDPKGFKRETEKIGELSQTLTCKLALLALQLSSNFTDTKTLVKAAYLLGVEHGLTVGRRMERIEAGKETLPTEADLDAIAEELKIMEKTMGMGGGAVPTIPGTEAA